jgi:aspartyl-tRNA(Asn)/glutamyl-tRNA(Gln) amidotransferase subunit B
VSPEDLALVQRRVADGTISGKISKELLKARFAGESASIDALIEQRGLRQISDATALEQLVDEVLALNEKQVADYRAGRDKAFNALVGQVMKATRGKANPVQVSEILRRKLKI